jgi:glycosyltransferase involved in cell wall biosynthesis
MSLPLVSIVIPVYNGEKYISEALESIIHQSYTNWECHVINNASTDRTPDIVSAFCVKDTRVFLHNYQQFMQIVDNWNRTVLHVSDQAKYFKLLQADDWIDSAFLDEMVSVMEKYPSAGMCSSYRIDGTVVNCDGLDYYQGQFYSGKEMLDMHIKEKIDITGSISTLMFRVDDLKKLPDYPEIFDRTDFHCDTQLAFDIMRVSDVGFVFKVLSYTRWHPEAFTSSTCVIYQTFFNGRERRLFKHKDLNADALRIYRMHRYHYGYFLLKRWMKNDKKALEWHKDRLLRKFTFREYMMAIWYFNPVNYRFFTLLKKFKR